MGCTVTPRRVAQLCGDLQHLATARGRRGLRRSRGLLRVLLESLNRGWPGGFAHRADRWSRADVWPATPEPVGAESVGAKDPGMRPIPRAARVPTLRLGVRVEGSASTPPCLSRATIVQAWNGWCGTAPAPNLSQRYNGVLAPDAGSRARVVAIGREAGDDEEGQEVEGDPKPIDTAPGGMMAPERVSAFAPRSAPSAFWPAGSAESKGATHSRALWALLLARIYVELLHRPPPFTPARGPPQVELAFDQSIAFDLSDSEPVPDHALRGAIYFDQFVADWPEPEG